MQKIRTLLDRFTDICLEMEKELKREALTEAEEDEAMLRLWHGLYGDDEPTPEELTNLWAELANDFAVQVASDTEDQVHAAQIVERHKKVTH